MAHEPIQTSPRLEAALPPDGEVSHLKPITGGMGPLGSAARSEVQEQPEEPALVSFAKFFEDDDLVTDVDRRSRYGSWLAS